MEFRCPVPSRRAEGGMCSSPGSGDRGAAGPAPALAFLAGQPFEAQFPFFGSAAGLAWSQLANTGVDLMLGLVLGGNDFKNKSRYDHSSESLFCNNFHIDAWLTVYLLLVLGMDRIQ